ncbi:DUF4176 domain-containing protein [Limosilactobacillus fermentum]|uniref:DUF4176 domain-containing protein n=1 Tax=Limosilactobacillus fermentum TaxID=1613 RepID=UPI0022EBEA06|nr:DUF4176 domain-containing protein [Limosilactobacillus fermentum]MDA3723578.1 DUF4176 domain-containing protein [Limosilactobacillus fermentum]MDA3762113.1 DUF4176 domain-containing protein [Limosilactobacillus fermentum]
MVLVGDDDERYFDYGTCAFPEGFDGRNLVYFNHDDIIEVILKGLADDDERLKAEELN